MSNLHQYVSYELKKLPEHKRYCICMVSILVGNGYLYTCTHTVSLCAKYLLLSLSTSYMLAATGTFCLILWREEDTYSIVPVTGIYSLLEEIIPGSICRVKGFEKFISEVVAMGTEQEMNQQLDLLDEDPPADDVETPQRDGKENDKPKRKRKGGRPPRDKNTPPTKKAKLTDKSKQKKEAKTPSRKKPVAPKKPGKILLVSSSASSASSPPQPAKQSAPEDLPLPPKVELYIEHIPRALCSHCSVVLRHTCVS